MSEDREPKEPSVLDYVKARLTPWRGPAPHIPQAPAKPELSRVTEPQRDARLEPLPFNRLLVWVPPGLALIAQRLLEPPGRSLDLGLALYLIAAVLYIWLAWKKIWQLPELPSTVLRTDPLTVRRDWLYLSLPLIVITYLSFGKFQFNGWNLTIWALTLVAMWRAFWVPRGWSLSACLQRWRATIAQREWTLRITPWTLAVLAVIGVALFFRLYRLADVPPEMISDHAEKLLDVADVLDGKWSVFFPRNTGREAIQMYLTAFVARVFGTGLSFLSLKISTALAGLLTLPFIYLLGCELGGRRVGLWAALFAGMAYWPNVIARIALRFALFPLFTAPVLYFLIRGLRRGERNDFLLAGLALGLGLHGYSPFRFVPLVVLVIVGIYLLHRASRGRRLSTVWALIALILISLVVFLPLMRYAVAHPQSFSYRTLTRLGTLERDYPGNPWIIFLDNTWRALVMFFWDNGEIWVHSVTHRPALDSVSAALFFLGVVLLGVRYLRRRQWEDLALLASIPLLMMPSILSLAFPGENPSLNRTGGALIPVFVIVGMAFESLLTRLKLGSRRGPLLTGIVALFLVLWASLQNYNLVFHQYYRQFRLSSWNTSEIGQVIRSFAETVGNYDQAWVVPYPYWVDTRLVGISAGRPLKDYALWPEKLETTLDAPQPKLFIYKPEDTQAEEVLQSLYPQGVVRRHLSPVEGKDFMIYFVP